MKKSMHFIALLSLPFMLSLVSCSKDSPTEPGQTLGERLQEALDKELRLHNVRGASAAVIAPGQDIWLGASGTSHGTTRAETDMIFGIGSITKNFMASIVLQLAEEGILTVNDSLHRWLPAFPNIDSTITLKQLLNHTSGVYDFTKNPIWEDRVLADMNRIWSPEETISAFVLTPLFAPGAGYQYSNTNYLLVGMIIKQATHSQISTQLRKRILNPLGLTHTFFSVEEQIGGTLAHRWGDTNDDGQLEDLSSYPRNSYDSMLWTCGAMYSTAEDIVKYSQALFNCRLFSQQSLNQMLTWIPYVHNPALGYGFGILILPDFVMGVRGFGHDGTVMGYKARWVHLPDQGVHIAVLLNEDDYDCLTAITNALANVALQQR